MSRALDATAEVGHHPTRTPRTANSHTGLALYTTATTGLTIVLVLGLAIPELTGLALATSTVTGIVLALVASLARTGPDRTGYAACGAPLYGGRRSGGPEARSGAEPPHQQGTRSTISTPLFSFSLSGTPDRWLGRHRPPLLVIREQRFHPAPPGSEGAGE